MKLWRDIGKGVYKIRYVYKPYHGWRHGYRREKWRRRLFFVLKLLLIAEGLILTERYIRQHTSEYVYEREAVWSEIDDRSNAFYGIGIDTEDGSVVWFHRRTETEEQK